MGVVAIQNLTSKTLLCSIRCISLNDKLAIKCGGIEFIIH